MYNKNRKGVFFDMVNVYKILNNSFVQVVITAIVSYIVAKMQSKSNARNIDKQVQAEIIKIDKQHEYELKRNNQNFLNKIIVENSFEVHETVSNYCYEQGNVADIILDVLGENTLTNTDKAEIMMNRIYEYNRKTKWSGAEANLIMVYMPELESQWRELLDLGVKIDVIYPKNIYNELKESNKTYNYDAFFEDVVKFETLGADLLSSIREEVRKTIRKLSLN